MGLLMEAIFEEKSKLSERIQISNNKLDQGKDKLGHDEKLDLKCDVHACKTTIKLLDGIINVYESVFGKTIKST